MTGQAFIIYLLGTVTIISLFMLALLVIWYSQNEKRERGRIAQSKADMADMAMLFQTMRDIMNQQKALARAFNQEIENKMNLVRQVLSTTLEKNEQLYGRQQQLAQALQESNAQLESLQRQMAYLRNEPPASTPLPPAQETAQPPVEAFSEPEIPIPQEDAPAPLPKPETAQDIRKWLAAEPETFAAPVRTEEEEPELEDAVLSPEEAQSARDAFRSLLNMTSPAPDTPRATPRAAGNGGANASLQQRVLEYSQAGMSIADIATELGVGKGEVRLMLSLGRQKRG